LLLEILLLIIVLGPPEQKDVWFRRMDLVMNPAQALLDANPPPFVIREEAERASVIVVEVTLRDEFEERFREDYMPVLKLFV